MEKIGHRCVCGCDKILYGSRQYSRGHKPARVKKTKEERSEASCRMWDKRGRAKTELRPCACGCGEIVKGKWAWGHHSRVNNISKREDIRKKRSENFIKMHEEGKLGETWNRGLTKEDSRVADYGRSHSEKFSDEHRKKVSEAIKKSWQNGSIVPLTGPNHSQWKGGVSRITERMRGSHKLYEAWKRPILVRDSFKCRKCGKDDDLEVHHDGERFSEILQKRMFSLFPECFDRELTFEEGSKVIDYVVDYHVRNGVTGLTLCTLCHEKEHSAA